jgi:hypothetical protein
MLLICTVPNIDVVASRTIFSREWRDGIWKIVRAGSLNGHTNYGNTLADPMELIRCIGNRL